MSPSPSSPSSPSTPPPVSDAELEVLKVLWDKGSGTVRDLEAHLRRRKKRWAYTTILTLLTRLRDKGYVVQKRGDERATAGGGGGGGAHFFEAAVTRQQMVGHGLTDLAERICDGTSSPLVHALVKSKRLSSDDIADLRRMLDQMEGKG